MLRLKKNVSKTNMIAWHTICTLATNGCVRWAGETRGHRDPQAGGSLFAVRTEGIEYVGALAIPVEIPRKKNLPAGIPVPAHPTPRSFSRNNRREQRWQQTNR